MGKEDANVSQPVIRFMVFFNGPMKECRQYSAAVHALSPVSYMSGVTELPGVMSVLGADANSQHCQPKGTGFMRGIDVNHNELPALRAWFDLFSDMLASDEAFSGSFCFLEGYSVQGVQAVPAESTAFPHRDRRLLQ